MLLAGKQLEFMFWLQISGKIAFSIRVPSSSHRENAQMMTPSAAIYLLSALQSSLTKAMHSMQKTEK